MLHKKNAFTLIELLVVISIIGIMLGIGYANLRGYQRRQFFNKAVEQVKGDLRLTHEMALAGEKPMSVCTVLDSYSFTTSGDESAYIIRPECSPEGPINDPIDVKTIPISETGAITISADQVIFFKVLGHGLRFSVGIDQATITITQTTSGMQETLVVTKTGEIIHND